jgi:hypothetical protein
MHLFRGLGGYWDLCLSSCFPQHSVFWCSASNWYSFGNHGPFDLCFCHHKIYDVSTQGLQLPEVSGIVELYIPSTMVASGNVASAPDAMVSAWGRGVDSSTAAGGFSSVAAASGSSPSQDRSIDFVRSTHWVVSQTRLLNSMYYSGMDFTYRLDRTTVTVGAPSMLAISMSPASAGASSSA